MSLYNSNDFHITLRSDMCQKHRPFTSIFDCKIRAHKRDPFLIEGKNEIRYHMGAYGSLVVEHLTEFHKKKLNKKVNNKNKNTRCKSKNYRTPFTYFNIHSNCKETEQCWHNLQSPQILRHYTPPKSSKRYEHYYGW